MKQTVPISKRVLLLTIAGAIFFYNLASYLTWVLRPAAENVRQITLSRILEFIPQCVFSILIVILLEYWRNNGSSLRSLIARSIPITYMASMLCMFLTNLLFMIIGRKTVPISLDYFRMSIYFLIPLVFILAVYAVVVAIYDAGYQREKAIASDRLLQEAKWQMLRYQINPHFLFNALNTVRSMLDETEEDARRIITELSEYFRFSLAENKSGLIELGKEFEAVKSFLEIQRMRYENKLSYNISIDQRISRCIIPLFSIQTLVENAVKYGAKTNGFPLELYIEATQSTGNLIIKICNPGKIYKAAKNSGTSDSNPGTKTGLLNLQKRLEVIYGKKASFSLSEEWNEVIATLRIPMTYYHEKMDSPDR